MSITCSIYGLGLQTNVPIASLAGLPEPRQVDVRLSVGEMPSDIEELAEHEAHEYFVSPYLDEHGEPDMRASSLLDARYHRISYSDGTTVVIDAQGTRVWAEGPENTSVEDTATCLLGPILGLTLRLRGITCLHGSAIAIGDRTIALVGPSGSGKSSTAAAFACLGYPVLTDDKVALTESDDHYLVQPAYPSIRLWAESVTSQFGSEDALPRITPNWDKRVLDLNRPGFHFQSEPLPLAAIYFLGERSSEPGAPHIEPITPRAGLMTLVSDMHASNLLNRERRALEFESLGRLVERVPLRHVRPSSEFGLIEQLCRVIVADFEQVVSAGCDEEDPVESTERAS